MCSRISSALAAVVLLAACGVSSDAPNGDVIECAIGPGAELSADCILESVAEGEFLIHSPDGGFRRFAKTGGPSIIATVDGADEVVWSAEDGETGVVEFGVGGDRYRLDGQLVASLGE